MPFLRLNAGLDFLFKQLQHSYTPLVMLRTQAPLTKCRSRWVPDSSMVNPPAKAGDSRSIPGLGKTPCRRKWQPTPIFLPWKFHGHRSLAVYSLWGHKESDTTNHPCTRHPTYLFPEECIACLEQLHSEFEAQPQDAPEKGKPVPPSPPGSYLGKFCFLKGNKNNQRGSTEDVYDYDHVTAWFVSIYEAPLFLPAQERPICTV